MAGVGDITGILLTGLMVGITHMVITILFIMVTMDLIIGDITTFLVIILKD